MVDCFVFVCRSPFDVAVKSTPSLKLVIFKEPESNRHSTIFCVYFPLHNILPHVGATAKYFLADRHHYSIHLPSVCVGTGHLPGNPNLSLPQPADWQYSPAAVTADPGPRAVCITCMTHGQGEGATADQ